MAGFTLSTPAAVSVSGGVWWLSAASSGASAVGGVSGGVVPGVRWPAEKRRGADKKGGPLGGPPFFLWSFGGGVLLSHTLAGAVPSALAVLASGFGKESPGVSLPL